MTEVRRLRHVTVAGMAPAAGARLRYDSITGMWVPSGDAYARAHKTGTQSVANNSATVVVLDTVDSDALSMVNVSTGVFTVPTGYGGLWLIIGTIVFPNTTAGFTRSEIQRSVGSPAIAAIEQMSFASPTIVNCLGVTVLVDGETLSLMAVQTNGSSVTLPANAATQMTAYRIGPTP